MTINYSYFCKLDIIRFYTCGIDTNKQQEKLGEYHKKNNHFIFCRKLTPLEEKEIAEVINKFYNIDFSFDKNIQNKKFEKIYYIVKLKDDFTMPYTTINKEFCGSIDHISDRIYFRLNGSNALVIIPDDKIEWMAPSKILWEHGYRKADK